MHILEKDSALLLPQFARFCTSDNMTALLLGPLSGRRSATAVALGLLLVALLTLLTQIGGLLLWLAYGIGALLSRQRQRPSKWPTAVAFALLYSLSTLFVVPMTAPFFGRVALNCISDGRHPYEANSLFYCALNRHYATPRLKGVIEETSAEMSRMHRGSVIGYLDAGFPFDVGLPMLPHLSHHDGRKLDLAFFYKGGPEKQPVPKAGLWFLGYWAFAPAWKLPYADRGSPNDGFLRWRFDRLQGLFEDYELDRERTGDLIRLLGSGPASKDVRRIFLEPYLKGPLGLTGGKVRFAGWNAARHDDHIHFEVF